MREKVLRYIREQGLMRAGNRVAVAVSGGADSVALLRVLLELKDEVGIVLAVAHFNHGLRAAESDADQAFVAELARKDGLEFFAGIGDVRDHAVLNKLSLEAAGRELRYQWFARLAETKRLDVVATAHTLDDQAETVLLKFLRGAGTKGLAGIWPVVGSGSAGAEAPQFNKGADGTPEGVPLQEGPVSGHEFTRADMRSYHSEPTSADGTLRGAARVVRPLLGVTRSEVEGYLESLGQSWREDASNLDHRFLRNRVRHELLPLLEREYSSNLRGALSDMAEISRGDEAYWEDVVARELMQRVDHGGPAGSDGASRIAPPWPKEGQIVAPRPGLKSGGISHPDAGPKSGASTGSLAGAPSDSGRLLLGGFAQLPVALQRRLLKRFAEDRGVAVDFEHVEKLRHCALGELTRTELPRGRIAVNAKTWLELRSCAPAAAATYEAVLPIPGEVQIAELGLTLRATTVPNVFASELPAGELLSRELLGSSLVIRNWLPGDRFWPAHSGSEEKLKRLFAEKHIHAEQRPAWPVALHEDEIVWVRGFPVARAYRWKGAGDAVRIEAVPSARP